MSAVNPSLRGQSFDGGQARPGSSGSLSSNHPPPFQQPNPPTPASSTAPGPPMRSISGSQPPQTGSPAGNNPSTSNNINTPIRPPGVLPPGARQPLALAEQRRQFLQSLVNWHKSNNIPPPPEIFNSERTGAIKMGDVWVEVVELFLTVLRIGGIDRVSHNASSTIPINAADESGNETPTRVTVLAGILQDQGYSKPTPYSHHSPSQVYRPTRRNNDRSRPIPYPSLHGLAIRLRTAHEQFENGPRTTSATEQDGWKSEIGSVTGSKSSSR